MYMRSLFSFGPHRASRPLSLESIEHPLASIPPHRGVACVSLLSSDNAFDDFPSCNRLACFTKNGKHNAGMWSDVVWLISRISSWPHGPEIVVRIEEQDNGF